MRSIRLALRLFVRIALVVVCAGAQASSDANIVVVTGDRVGVYLEAEEALIAGLQPELRRGTEVIDSGALDAGRLDRARVVVTIGSQAAKAVAARRPSTAVLHTLLPRDAFEALPAPSQGKQSSAVLLDQPEPRQLALLAAALPDRSRIALLASPRSARHVQRMLEAAGERKMQVEVARIEDEKDIYPALERLLEDSPVLIAQPDGSIYNTYTIQNILLTSYRHRSPLLGFSPAYIKAGALLALYTTPAQIGRQAAMAVSALFAGRGLPAPQGPREFEVGSNPVVARALGISLPPTEVIAARVREQEALREARQ